MQEFIDKYFSEYVKLSRIHNPFIESGLSIPIPPTSLEMQEIISYLKENDLDPIVVGTIAVIKHLKLTNEEIRRGEVRPTARLEIFVSRKPSAPPEGWHVAPPSEDKIFWTSPSGGQASILVAGQKLSNGIQIPESIGKDPESELAGCPIGNVLSLFQMKLNSSLPKDLTDFLNIAVRIGIPDDLQEDLLNSRQKHNLKAARFWLKHRAARQNRVEDGEEHV